MNQPAAFHGTCHTVLSRANHWKLAWARWSQSTSSIYHCLNIHLNIILIPTPRSSEWFLLFRYFDQKFVCISHLSSVCCVSLRSHRLQFLHPGNIWTKVKVMKFLLWIIYIIVSLLLSLVQILYPQIPSTCVFLWGKKPIFSPYKTAGFFFLLFLFLVLLGQKQEAISSELNDTKHPKLHLLWISSCFVCCCHSQVSEHCYTCKGFVSCLLLKSIWINMDFNLPAECMTPATQ